MAYAIVHHFTDGGKDQYDAVRAVVHPADGLPEGQLHHFAGETADGFVVVAVHNSKESWERFRDETLMPGIHSVGDKGFDAPPEAMEFEVQNELHA